MQVGHVVLGKPIVRLGHRVMSVQVLSKSKASPRTDQEWLLAKDFSEIPGPSRSKLIFYHLPGGKLHKSNLKQLHEILRHEYGDIFRLKGILGKPDVVFTYNPVDIEKVYRTEGLWPIRRGLDSFEYYRKHVRPDIFQNTGGLVTDQGKHWGDFRTKVNPILLKVQTVKQSLPVIDEIASEFIQKLEYLRNPKTNRLQRDFLEELKLWALESMTYIALNKRLELLTNSGGKSPFAADMSESVANLFQLMFEMDIQPSIWKYYQTSKFKRLLQIYDTITNITTTLINEAAEKFGNTKGAKPSSVFEKLFCIDKDVALVMAVDMLIAGIDTTSSTLVTMLYLIAKNPSKQEVLREEIMTILPEKTTRLTVDNTKNMPYLRACIKESLRVIPITPANFRETGADLVLSNYRVPKGIGVSMGNMILSNSSDYFARSSEFLPERWLKSGEQACPNARSTNPFVYLPFGFGPRTCIGKRIAQLELETLMSKLIRNYKITWEGNDLTYTSNTILVPSGEMRFKFEPL